MTGNIKKQAILFLVLLGVISLLSDFTHEGARSIYAPFLGLIGASAFVVSFTSGLGEFIGQALRIATGVIADKSKKYWGMMFLGYAVNLLAIPLLAFVDASIWQVAIVLILLERVGKAIRAPAKSALVSFTTPHLGAGKSFAIQEVLDQIGAFLGPLFAFAILSFNQGSELNSKSWEERIRSFDDALRERLSRTFGKEIRRRGYGNSANYGLLIFETKKTQ